MASLVSRFILDLRGIVQTGAATVDLTTIRFEPGSLAGNFGAPLGADSVWTTGAADDVQSHHGEHFRGAKEPFAAILEADENSREEYGLDSQYVAGSLVLLSSVDRVSYVPGIQTYALITLMVLSSFRARGPRRHDWNVDWNMSLFSYLDLCIVRSFITMLDRI